MAFAPKPNLSFMVIPGKEKSFFEKINAACPTKDFWDDCKRIRENINQDTINEINSLMDKADK